MLAPALPLPCPWRPRPPTPDLAPPSSYTCNTDGRFRFGSNDVWNAGYISSASINGINGIDVLRSNSGGYLWWDGDGRNLLAVNACWGAWQCTWRLQAP